jgi:ribonuclease R
MSESTNPFVPSPEDEANRVLQTARRALTLREVHRRLGLKISKARLRSVLRSLEQEGKVVRRRGNRWEISPAGIPRRKWTGRLQLTWKGGVVRDIESDRPAARVRPDDLRFALDGDLVEVETIGKAARPMPLDRRPLVRVVRVMERKRETLVGRLERTANHWYAIPDDARIPWSVPLRPFDGIRSLEGRRVVVRLEPWTTGRPMPIGEVVEDLGPALASETRRRALYRRHGLNPLHGERVRREAQRAPREPDAADREGRADLREVPTITIDPTDARDFDDAVSLQSLGSEGWRLDVHIADVGHYVPEGSATDREARERGTTVYLADEAITMLPPELTTEVCSLQPGRDRLCWTVRMDIAADGSIRRDEAFPSVIRSRTRWSYEEVQGVIVGSDGGSAGDGVSMVREMHRLATVLRRRRMAAGALDLSTPEVRLEWRANGDIAAIRPRGCDEAYHLIEEFMLLANRAIAWRLSRAGVPTLYRVHPAPEDDQWALMEAELMDMGLELRRHDRAAINETLSAVQGTPKAYPAGLAVLRNLKRAVYSAHRSEHFGLATAHYTHFTSPIRRYPDLIVHRQWAALASDRPPPYAPAELAFLADHCSRREREADEAEADSMIEKRIAYYAQRFEKGEVGPHEAVITAVRGRTVWAELIESLQRGLVLPAPAVVRGRRRRARRWRPGDTLGVEIARVDPRKRRVDFRPVDTRIPPCP